MGEGGGSPTSWTVLWGDNRTEAGRTQQTSSRCFSRVWWTAQTFDVTFSLIIRNDDLQLRLTAHCITVGVCSGTATVSWTCFLFSSRGFSPFATMDVCCHWISILHQAATVCASGRHPLYLETFNIQLVSNGSWRHGLPFKRHQTVASSAPFRNPAVAPSQLGSGFLYLSRGVTQENPQLWSKHEAQQNRRLFNGRQEKRSISSPPQSVL